MRRTERLEHDALDPRQFDIAVKSLANSVSYGMDDSTFAGAGIENLQSRPPTSTPSVVAERGGNRQSSRPQSVLTGNPAG